LHVSLGTVTTRIATAREIKAEDRKADLRKPVGQLPIGTVGEDILMPPRGAEHNAAISKAPRPGRMITPKERLARCIEIQGLYTFSRHAYMHNSSPPR